MKLTISLMILMFTGCATAEMPADCKRIFIRGEGPVWICPTPEETNAN